MTALSVKESGLPGTFWKDKLKGLAEVVNCRRVIFQDKGLPGSPGCSIWGWVSIPLGSSVPFSLPVL